MHPRYERTFVAVKPDGVQRAIVGDIISRFEKRGYKLVALKMITASKTHLELHYQDLKDKPFFPSLISYMGSGPIVAMVWEGLDAVEQGRVMLGTTNPLASKPGTIRRDYCIQTGRNICHGSDSVDSAKWEISHWFKPEELNEYKSDQINKWVYEEVLPASKETIKKVRSYLGKKKEEEKVEENEEKDVEHTSRRPPP